MKLSMFKKSIIASVLGFSLTFGCASSDEQQQSEDTLEVTEGDEVVEMDSESEESDQEEQVEMASEEVVEEPEVYEPDESLADETSSEEAQNEELVSLDEEPVEYVEEESIEEPVEESEQVEMASEEEMEEEVAHHDTGSSNSFEYTVVRGDSVSALALRVYGSFDSWRDIADASNLSNPDTIFPGNRLTVPLINDQARDFARSYSPDQFADNGGSSEDQVSVTVEEGDTLSSLAAQHLGDVGSWKSIYEQNSGDISDPNLIYPGQQITFSKSRMSH